MRDAQVLIQTGCLVFAASLARPARLACPAPLSQPCRAIEALLCRNDFSAAGYVADWDLMTDSKRFKLSG